MIVIPLAGNGVTAAKTDLVKRLRKHAQIADATCGPHCNLLHEAADEIDRLRETLRGIVASDEEPTQPISSEVCICPYKQADGEGKPAELYIDDKCPIHGVRESEK